MKLYSRLLLNKSSYLEEGALKTSEVFNIPPLKQWLLVVGLTPDAIRVSNHLFSVIFVCPVSLNYATCFICAGCL